MRKIAVLLVAILVLSLSAVSMANNWEDGSYEGWADAGKRSYQYAKVFVEDGEMTSVILREFTWMDVEKDWFSYKWEEAVKAAQTMGNQFLEAQSSELDVVSGATGTSTGWMQAVERALLKADPTYKPDGEFHDGTFLGRSYTSSRNYYEVVWVTLEDDQIVDMKIERVLPTGEFLDLADYKWALGPARDAYIEQAQEAVPGDVDIMTGATGAFKMWNAAVKDALDKARVQ